MTPRDKAQKTIYSIINPAVNLLVKLRITPNAITSAGLIINLLAAIIFIIGGEHGERGDLSYIGWGCGLILFAGLFDMLDGQVARLGNKTSRFGALYDSVLDRYSELIMFLGICYYLVAHHYFLSSLVTFIALIGSMMVSYVRARAEGLGIECKEGLMQRPERIIIISVSGIICGIVSACSGGNQKFYISWLDIDIIETISIFIYPIALVAVMANFTAIKRLNHCKKQLSKNKS
ncbi:MAG TPA: CDP-alcohol phosphatidyltransferase family protein [Bacteroidales bacterium]